MMKKRREELIEHVIGELSHTEAFVKKIGELLKQGLTVENYTSTLQSVIGLCKGSYDLNRAGTLAVEVAEQQLYRRETFNPYWRGLYRSWQESTQLWLKRFSSAMRRF